MLNDSKELRGFLIKAAIAFLSWYLFENYYLVHDSNAVNDWLTLNIAEVGGWMVSLFGYQAIGLKAAPYINLIIVDGTPLVRIEAGCNGLVLMYLFAAFIIAYPGPLKAKLWFVPAGVLVIYFVNLLRVVALVFNKMYSSSTFDFNHKYTYLISVYAVIFGLWMLWVNKIVKNDTPESEVEAAA